MENGSEGAVEVKRLNGIERFSHILAVYWGDLQQIFTLENIVKVG